MCSWVNSIHSYIKIDALCEVLQEEYKEHQEIQPVYQESPIRNCMILIKETIINPSIKHFWKYDITPAPNDVHE